MSKSSLNNLYLVNDTVGYQILASSVIGVEYNESTHKIQKVYTTGATFTTDAFRDATTDSQAWLLSRFPEVTN